MSHRSPQWPKHTHTSWNKFKHNDNDDNRLIGKITNSNSNYESATKTNNPHNYIFSAVANNNTSFNPTILNNTNNNNLTDNLVDVYINSSRLFNLSYDEANQNEAEVKGSGFSSLSASFPPSETVNNAIAQNQNTSSNQSVTASNRLHPPPQQQQQQEQHQIPQDVEETSSTKLFLQKLMTTLGLNTCPPIPPNLIGPIEINTDVEPLAAVEQRLHDQLQPGGWYKPQECNARDRVAIVIPYRDRATHLPVFLKNIHPFLMKQQIEYGIFIVEQISDGLFNRAAIMNVGFIEALKLNNWDCFIFHDIDLIPMDDRNLYTCPDQPRHMSVAVDTMGFK